MAIGRLHPDVMRVLLQQQQALDSLGIFDHLNRHLDRLLYETMTGGASQPQESTLTMEKLRQAAAAMQQESTSFEDAHKRPEADIDLVRQPDGSYSVPKMIGRKR